MFDLWVVRYLALAAMREGERERDFLAINPVPTGHRSCARGGGGDASCEVACLLEGWG